MCHHSLAILPSDLHRIHLLFSYVLLQCLAVLGFVITLLVDMPLCHRIRAHSNDTIFLHFRLSIFQSKLVDHNGFTLVWQARALTVNVLVVSVTNDLSVWQSDLTRRQELCLLDVEVGEGLGSGLARSLAMHHLLQGRCVRAGG